MAMHTLSASTSGYNSNALPITGYLLNTAQQLTQSHRGVMMLDDTSSA